VRDACRRLLGRECRERGPNYSSSDCKNVDPGVTHVVRVFGGPSGLYTGTNRTPYDRPVPFREHIALEALRERDPVALRRVVDQHGRRLYRAARGMGFSPDDAEDLAQEVFATFLQTIERFEGRSEVGTWLFGILYRKAHERRRTHAREEPLDELDEAFEARFNRDGSWREPPIPADRLVAAGETAHALRECLAGLPAQYREVFQLRQVDDLSAADVSGMLGCSINHVGVMFHRARVRLRACLEAKGWGRSR